MTKNPDPKLLAAVIGEDAARALDGRTPYQHADGTPFVDDRPSVATHDFNGQPLTSDDDQPEVIDWAHTRTAVALNDAARVSNTWKCHVYDWTDEELGVYAYVGLYPAAGTDLPWLLYAGTSPHVTLGIPRESRYATAGEARRVLTDAILRLIVAQRAETVAELDAEIAAAKAAEQIDHF